MKATHVSAWLFAATIAGGGCAGTGEVAYSGTAAPSPDLVYVEPGVQVVRDADEPTFYVDGSYWLYRDNLWMRSDSDRGGWVRVDRVPERVRGIREPRAYLHYRADVQARDRMPRQREQRSQQPSYDPPQQTEMQHHDEWRDQQPQSQPAVPPPANPMPQQHSPGPQQPNQPRVPVDQRPMPDHHDLAPTDHHDDGDHDRTDRNQHIDQGDRRAPEPTDRAHDRHDQERRDQDRRDRERHNQ